MLFGQTFDPVDAGTIGMLVVLEGILSIDNALILGVLAGRVPEDRQAKALSYGLIGAVLFRLLGVLLAAYLLRWQALKLIGGTYLVFIALRHLLFTSKPTKTAARSDASTSPPLEGTSARWQFWKSVAAIELTDMVFAVDNILAAVALVGPPPHGTPLGAIHPKLWVILTGGMLGVVLMRFAAAACLALLKRFPRFGASAYLIVLLVAIKMLLDWGANIDFQNPRGAPFWVFWGGMAVCLAAGFLPGERPRTAIEG